MYSSYYFDHDYDSPKHFYAVDNYLIGSNSLYGIILSLFFFSQNNDARILLLSFIKQKILCYKNNDDNGLDSLKIQMRVSDISEKSFSSNADTSKTNTIQINTSKNILRI